MLLGLDASQWSAIGTLGLLGVTAVYAFLTTRISRSSVTAAHAASNSAKAAERSARASEDAASVAERSLRLQAMPLILGHSAHMDGGHAKIEIAGEGVALQVTATVRQSGVEGGSGVIAMVDPRMTSSLDILPPFVVDHTQPYEVEMSYVDRLGHGYRTVRHSMVGRESKIQVEAWDEESGDWQKLV